MNGTFDWKNNSHNCRSSGSKIFLQWVEFEQTQLILSKITKLFTKQISTYSSVQRKFNKHLIWTWNIQGTVDRFHRYKYFVERTLQLYIGKLTYPEGRGTELILLLFSGFSCGQFLLISSWVIDRCIKWV